jgi:hypothetical protein
MTDDRIDMSSLTVKELIVLMNDKLIRIDMKITEYEREIMSIKLKIAELQTRMAVWATVLGFAAGIASTLIANLLKM